MKRIIAILLLVTICLTTLASCSVVDAVVDNVYGYLDQIFAFEKFDYLLLICILVYLSFPFVFHVLCFNDFLYIFLFIL